MQVFSTQMDSIRDSVTLLSRPETTVSRTERGADQMALNVFMLYLCCEKCVPDKRAAREPGNKRAFSRLFSRDQALRACQAVARLDRISLYARISCGAQGLVSTSDLLFLLYFIFRIRTLI